MENNPLYLKVKVTKSMYKSFDSYNRRQKWVLREIIRALKSYGK